jgi:hypothetical protein
MRPEWLNILGESPMDAVLSTTARPWLAPESLTRVYRALGALVRPGGVFLHGDHRTCGPHLPSCQKVVQTVQERVRIEAFERRGLEDWDRWWQTLQAEASLAALVAERERCFSG